MWEISTSPSLSHCISLELYLICHFIHSVNFNFNDCFFFHFSSFIYFFFKPAFIVSCPFNMIFIPSFIFLVCDHSDYFSISRVVSLIVASAGRMLSWVICDFFGERIIRLCGFCSSFVLFFPVGFSCIQGYGRVLTRLIELFCAGFNQALQRSHWLWASFYINFLV